MDNFTFIELNNTNFFYNSLDNFKRFQNVHKCWRKVSENYVLLPISYIEDWTLSDCREIAKRILLEISLGSIAFGVLCDNEIIGFALIDNKRFGSKNQYIDLAEFYVSEPYRRKGVGKELFKMACSVAKKLGGTKLYISAHSAEESILAYKSYGCIFAKEINQVLAEKEPCDIQLEYEIK